MSTVVWNPWKEKAQAMTDFGDDEVNAYFKILYANPIYNNCMSCASILVLAVQKHGVC